MWLRIFFAVAFLWNPDLLLAQTRTDFRVRVQNSFAKLFEDPDLALRAAREINTKEEQPYVNDILTQAYLLKGDYTEAGRTAALLETNPTSVENKKYRLMQARQLLALGLAEDAEKLIHPLLRIKASPAEHEIYAQLYQLAAQINIYQKKLKAAEQNLAQSSALLTDNSEAISTNRIYNDYLLAEISYLKNDIPEAKLKLDTVQQKLSAFPKARYLMALSGSLEAKILFDSRDFQRAVEVLNASLDALQNAAYMPLREEISQNLARNYLVLNDIRNYKKFDAQFRKTAEMLAHNQREARRDLLRLQMDQTATLLKSGKTKAKNTIYYVTVPLFLLFLIAFIGWWRSYQRGNQLGKQLTLFRRLSRPVISKQIPETAAPRKNSTINPEKEQELREKLDTFEQSEDFLDKNMSLATLAAQFDTNTKYLSEVINTYKNCNYNAYINDLRIRYLLKLLATNPSYLQYKISYIADLAGFSSHSSFTNVFKNSTGLSPNEYMQNLRNS